MSESREPYTTRPTAIISMPAEERDKLVADTRREEMEQCCRDTCSYCEKGLPLVQAANVFDERGPKQWAHKIKGETFSKLCNAYAIRQRWAKQERG